MSEFDSLSDSDWLDISSNGRGDSDNDSIASQDSDRDDHSNSRPISRLSSFSNASSVNGEVDAWEGLLSDGGDDAAEVPHGMYPTPPLSTPNPQLPPSAGIIEHLLEGGSVAKDVQEQEEDERVRMALDQSFVGTLNASRSSALTHSLGSNSAHTSIRDLRLSFPDPLTSSTPDKLNSSFEEVSSTEAGDNSLSTGSDISTSMTCDDSLVLPSVPPQDPGRFISTPAVRHHEAQLSGSTDLSELEIVLYGSSSSTKWQFVQQLIQKAASYAEYALHDAAQLEATANSRATVRLIKESEQALPFFDIVIVLDRTTGAERNDQTALDSYESVNRPSLAIVFLPVAKLPPLAWHTSYLPVVVPMDSEEKGPVLAAEDDWDLLGVPQYRTSRLSVGGSRFFDSQRLDTIVAGRAYYLLHGLLDEVEEPITKPLTEHLKSVNTVKLFVSSLLSRLARCSVIDISLRVALMSLFVGFAVNTAFPSSAPAPTPTINRATTTNVWRILAEQNESVIPQARGGTSNSALLPSSVILSDVSLSLFNPGTTALSVPSPPEAKSVSLTASASSKALSEISTMSPCVQCKITGSASTSIAATSSLSVIKTVSSDVVLRPAATPTSIKGEAAEPLKPQNIQLKTPTSAPARSKALSATNGETSLIVAPVAGPSSAPATPVASCSYSTPSTSSAPLNAKEAVVNSVSEAFDTSAKVFSDVVNTVGSMIPDLDAELLEATNGLYSSLLEQTDKAVKKWHSNKGKAKEGLVNANGRAKKNARKIKEKGTEYFWSAGQQLGQHLADRTKRAKQNAKEVWGMAAGVNGGAGEDGDGLEYESWLDWESGFPRLTKKEKRKLRRDARRAAREADAGKENAVPWTTGTGGEAEGAGCPRRRSGQAPCAPIPPPIEELGIQGMFRFQFGF